MKTKKTIISLLAISAFSLNVMAGDGKTDNNENPNKYCTKMKDGKLRVMHEGTELTSDVTLANGTKIKTDGTVIKKDGTKMMMKEGECIDVEGKVVKEKTTKTENKKSY